MQTSKGACRLCGDPTLDTEGIPYDGLKCVRESLCERDARQFETWTYQNRSRRYPRESPVTDDDLLTYIANIVQKLAKLQSQGFGIHRCAVRSPERCVRFANTLYEGHCVCGRHSAHLRGKQLKRERYTFDDRHVTSARIYALVQQLLGSEQSTP